jgi:hypothetical protein
MATYIWVGRSIGPSSSTADKIDQYCFNAPGNWLLDTGAEIVPTTETPKWLDQFFIGGGVSLFGAVNKPGYTAAKSPCLYGGFSGNVHLGTWGHTSAASTGTTLTTAVGNCYLGDFGYPFPWIGGGISGDILRWCAYRDGISLANAATFYTAANSTGFRNPSENLKLKIKSNFYLYSDKVRIPSPYDGQGTPELHTQATKFIIDIEPIHCYSSLVFWNDGGGSTLVGWNTSTELKTYTFNSGGVRVRGGAFHNIQLDRLIAQGQSRNQLEIPNLPEYKYDAGIELYNTVAHTVSSANWCRHLHKDCMYAKVTHYGRLTGLTYYGYDIPYTFGQSLPLEQTTTAAEVSFQSSINQYIAFDVLYGITGSAVDGIRDSGTDGYGVLEIRVPVGNVVAGNSTPEGDVVWDSSIERQWTEENQIPTRSRDFFRSMVNPVKLGGGSHTTRIPFVKANGIDGSGASRPTIPTSIQIAGDVDIGTIYAGYGVRVEAADDIDTSAIARIGEVTLEKSAKVDFGTRGSHFTNWFIGGISGGSASQEGVAYGGILFKDDTTFSYVRGGPSSVFWSTQTEEGFNVRQPSVLVPEVGLPEPLA